MAPFPPAATSNFEFLRDEFSVLYTLGKEAEFQLYPNPAATYLRSQIAQNYFQSIARGMAVKGVSIGDSRPFPIAIPPQEEQQEIVRQVNHYFELAEQLEARFEQAAALVEQLPQALLAKAFSGQLVSQDPDDESASALLERLHAEPAAPVKGKRGRKAKVSADAPLFE